MRWNLTLQRAFNICLLSITWMTITLDGFGSHLEGGALKVFMDHKILIVKEEGDTSQVCQSYDNEVGKTKNAIIVIS